ncbi:Zn-ribbon domain-containing OB-fold protein [Nocardioides daeguensis]|uniref:OB-fold nucleic acid binding domain-containing protein n=1 Tax=Nocardioides daeguensis TaxID=908359 RepID=A0ABP6W1E5_9ACTN|nr:OB-fold nucleic acid binding domain-containing protein [Nocardioides daeguensis]MBV6726758.1 OB-fold domain-containing protein [Nocardioides daeguensis]MCR1774490.1 OB-fold domain-containing protein [Nocardioides daeguensis]
MSRTLSAPVTVSFDYTRSVGPVIGRFLTGLRDAQFVGARLSDGRVVVPPPEYDPVTHRATADFVEVAETGTVTSWTWVSEPVAGQPFDRPFAFALVTLDGTDAPLLHAVDVASPDEINTGMRVRARWAAERTGAITDVVFVPDTGTATAPPPAAGEGDVTGIVTPVSLDYTYAASPEESAFFRGLAEGRIIAQRCPKCQKVYVPPRPACPVDGVPTVEEIELPDTGTVTTFCIVNVPFLGQKITPPYVSAYILLDGADIALQHLILDIPVEEIRMGLRVKAVWKPREEWGTTIENISHFAPTGEPDADYDTYKHHL